jgi:hypothetical protein
MIAGPPLVGTFELAKTSIGRFSSYFESCEMMSVMIIVLQRTAVPRNNHHHHFSCCSALFYMLLCSPQYYPSDPTFRACVVYQRNPHM